MPQIVTVREGTKGAFTPYGGAREFMDFLAGEEHQCFLYGGTGTGKTTALCYAMVLLCMKYPGVKFLFTRKSYRSLIKSGVETLERVIGEMGMSIGKRADQIKKLGETEPREFRFPHSRRKDETGKLYEGVSRIVLSSLDKVKDELGAEYDYIYVNQPEQCTEEDWQFLATRCNGRRGVAPRPKLFGDPNPEHERHWIKLGGYYVKDGKHADKDGRPLEEDGRWRLITSTFHDNPSVWDATAEGVCPYSGKPGAFTDSGEDQIGRLMQSLNPVMKRRLIDSEWASFEGLVYGESWVRREHTISQEKFLENYDITDWKRYWGVDFGFTDPFVLTLWAKHPFEELYIRYKSIYMSGRTINDHVEKIKAHTIGEPKPTLVVADRNPESIMILQEALGINVLSATKGAGSIKAGIDVVTDMLQNKSLLFVLDSQVEIDERMRAKKKPIGFEEEVDNYRWDIEKGNDKVIGGDDHELDAVRYLFTYIKAHEMKVQFKWI